MPSLKRFRSEEHGKSSSKRKLSTNDKSSDFKSWFLAVKSELIAAASPIGENAASLLSDDQDTEMARFRKRFEVKTGDTEFFAQTECTKALLARKQAAHAIFSRLIDGLSKELSDRLEENDEFQKLQTEGGLEPHKLKTLIQGIVLSSRHTNLLLTCQDLLRQVLNASARDGETAERFLSRFQELVDELESIAPLRLLTGDSSVGGKLQIQPITPIKYRTPSRPSTPPNTGTELEDVDELEASIQTGLSQSFYVMAAVKGLPDQVADVKRDLLKVFDTKGDKIGFPKSLDELRARCVAAVARESMTSNHSFRKKTDANPTPRSHLTASQTQRRQPGSKHPKPKDKDKDKDKDKNKDKDKDFDKDARRLEGLCFNCGKLGHKSRECPSKSESKVMLTLDEAREMFAPTEDSKRVRIHATIADNFYLPKTGDLDDFHFGGLQRESEDEESTPVQEPTRGILKRPAPSFAHYTENEDPEEETDVILLDGCANISVVCRESLCTNVAHFQTRRPITTTFGTQVQSFDAKGTINIGGVRLRVLIDLNATSNIIAEEDFEIAAAAQGFRIEKVASGRSSELRLIRNSDAETTMRFGFLNGLRSAVLPRVTAMHLTGYGSEITEEQLRRAIKARGAEERLGFISTKQMQMALSRGSVISDIRPRDATHAKEALGPSPVRLKAKATREKIKLLKLTKEIETQVVQTVHADTFFVSEKAFLVATALPMGYISVAHLKGDKSAGHEQLKQKLLWHRRILEDRGHTVDATHFDGELEVCRTSELQMSDYPNLMIHPPNQHVGVAERSIRTVKDVLRCFVLAKPELPWYGRFLTEAVCSIGFFANVRYPKHNPAAPTPIQQITGRSIVLDRDLPASLGDLVLVERILDANGNKQHDAERMEEAVFLRPTMDRHSSAHVLLLRSGMVVKRTNVVQTIWTDVHLKRLAAWAGGPRTDTAAVTVRNKKGDPEVRIREWQPDIEPEFDVEVLVGERELPIYTRHQYGVDIPATERTDPALTTSAQNGPALTNNQDSGGVSRTDPALTTSAQAGAAKSNASMHEGATRTGPALTTSAQAGAAKSNASMHEGATRTGPALTTSAQKDTAKTNKPPPRVYKPSIPSMKKKGTRKDPDTPFINGDDVSHTTDEIGEELVLEEPTRRSGRERRVSFKIMRTTSGAELEVLTTTIAKNMKGIREISDDVTRREAVTALRGEMTNIFLTHEALTPVAQSDINFRNAEVLPMSFFVDRKYVGGSYTKTKARLVAGGHRQDKEEYRAFASQTVCTESLFIILAIAQHERRHCGVVDVSGAFLNAKMEHPDHKDIYLKMSAELAELLVEILPSCSHCRNRDGSIYVRADKAIYGCVQSSHLWQKLLTLKLIEMGFRICSYDKCVAIRASDGLIVCFHVDDIFVAAKTQKSRDDFVSDFGKIFNITSDTGDELDYLGMHIVVRDGSIVIDQHAFVAKLIEGVTGSVTTPVLPFDQEVYDDTVLDSEGTASYRSKVAKCLYLAKRSRPDILFAVNILARASQAPRVTDRDRLQRLLKYLNFSRGRILKLHAKDLRLNAYIDAAFATHGDRRSHTGAFISVGGALMWAKSVKQTIVTKSSTEAELVALSDMTSMLLWASMLMAELGFRHVHGKPMAYQDNQSTMSIVQKGATSSERTRHIDTRFMWMKQLLDDGQLELCYCPTNEMVADVLTKPLTADKFAKFAIAMGVAAANDYTTVINLLLDASR